jgi:outer membrane immunogenic protein
MRWILGVVSLLIWSCVASAADLAPLQKKAAPVGATSWSGLYFGLQGGMNLGSFNPIFGSGPAATKVDFSDNSPIVGGHMGYLVQAGSLVVGAEAGLQWMGFKTKTTVGTEAPVLLQEKVDWMAYVGARAGVVLGEYLLAYADGGAAFAHQKGEAINLAQLSNTQALNGWYVGAGLEYQLSARSRLGVEYKHVDFGDVTPIIGISPKGMTFDQVVGRLSFSL